MNVPVRDEGVRARRDNENNVRDVRAVSPLGHRTRLPQTQCMVLLIINVIKQLQRTSMYTHYPRHD